MKFTIMFLSMVILYGCSGRSEYQLTVMQSNNNSLLKALHGTYQIQRLNDKDVSSYKLNITFNDSIKQISGFAGCNRFFGSYTLKNNMLKFGTLGSTKMLCDEASNRIENQLLKAFEQANLVSFTDDGFSIYNEKQELFTTTKEDINVNVRFEYSAISRDTYKLIKINQKSVSSITKQKGKPKEKTCHKSDWQKLIKAFEAFEVKDMPNLKAPSEKRFFDGAAIANLTVTYNGKVYESQSFDHGNPPKEFALLVKEILSIAQNIE